MTRDEFIDLAFIEYQKNEQIKELQSQRVLEEKSLSDEYKVDECNTKRNALLVKYTNLIQAVRNS